MIYYYKFGAIPLLAVQVILGYQIPAARHNDGTTNVIAKASQQLVEYLHRP